MFHLVMGEKQSRGQSRVFFSNAIAMLYVLGFVALIVVVTLLTVWATVSDCEAALGNELWVSPTGSDGADGSQGAPLQTINAAAAQAGPGTKIILTEGQYVGPIQIASSGGDSNPIHLTAPSGVKAEIVYDQANGQGEAVRITGSHIVVSNLTITGLNASQANNYGYGILVEGRDADAHHIIISGNTVSGFSIGGIAANWTNHVHIEGNRVFGNSNWGAEGGSGISILETSDAGGYGATNRIMGNTVYDNRQLVDSTKIGQNSITDGNCIQLDRLDIGPGAGQQAVVQDNIAYSCGGRGVNVWDSSNVVVRNNVTWHNGLTASLNAEVYVEGDNVSLIGNVLAPRPGAEALVGTPALTENNQVLNPEATLEEALACWTPLSGAHGAADFPTTTVAPPTTAPEAQPEAPPPEVFVQPEETPETPAETPPTTARREATTTTCEDDLICDVEPGGQCGVPKTDSFNELVGLDDQTYSRWRTVGWFFAGVALAGFGYLMYWAYSPLFHKAYERFGRPGSGRVQ